MHPTESEKVHLCSTIESLEVGVSSRIQGGKTEASARARELHCLGKRSDEVDCCYATTVNGCGCASRQPAQIHAQLRQYLHPLSLSPGLPFSSRSFFDDSTRDKRRWRLRWLSALRTIGSQASCLLQSHEPTNRRRRSRRNQRLQWRANRRGDEMR